MKFTTAILLASLVSNALAFESTVPCLLWSSKESYLKTSTNDQLILKNADASNAVLNFLSSDICSSQLVAVIDQPGLHRSDLASLKSIKDHSQSASSYTQLEYIENGIDINAVAQAIGNQCGSDITNIKQDDTIKQLNTKIITVTLPEDAENNEHKVDQLLTLIQEQSNDDYVVIYTSSIPKESKQSGLTRRAPSDKPNVQLPIFAKYQLFSPAIFMSLGVVLLFVFIAGTGITWLVGIQTPPRFEGKQKKN
ncbi:uncharacterized protein BX664DRAFT_340340 [Halteromyces radiatus]|uniref:uncharacterized protein n=1 Tax=Halteromyces radiatus TaxID=101107 RepID=UPI00221ED8A4|nr:uncharacterized protein BX664DRAFT_340340 [Halteromyces radiatus]KAI8081413.1 hypothetical protein BX664DRAFT_340340 [Halteromyces radiatus]